MVKNPVEDLGWRTERESLPFDLPNRVSSDSRRIEPGQWFMPIRGANFDGHDFIQAAVDKGAAGFFFESRLREHLKPELRKLGIEVQDTTKALQDLARWWRQAIGCKVVGITGSSGKTTVKEMAAAMLHSIAPTLKTEGSLNNELGTPLTLCRLTPLHRFAVIEMGARHKGDIEFLSKIALQDIGVLLNVGSAHVGEFGGPLKILEAKMEIAAAPTAVYFKDDARIDEAMRGLKNKNVVSFGRDPGADVRLLDTELDGSGKIRIHFEIRGQKQTIVSNFYHSSFPINAATCLAIGLALNLDLKDCVAGLQSFQGVKGRFKVHTLRHQLLIDDCYNANPESMKAGLSTLRDAYRNRKTYLILGDMLELGDSSEAAHREIGAFCAREIKPAKLLTVGPMSRWIAEEAMRSGLPADRVEQFTNVDQVITQLPAFWPDAELLYVKASNGLRLSKIIDTLLTP
jgi:UDP-N-acetylmuramoyl-tripeptide--D-alanyl-D-alanine ligase